MQKTPLNAHADMPPSDRGLVLSHHHLCLYIQSMKSGKSVHAHSINETTLSLVAQHGNKCQNLICWYHVNNVWVKVFRINPDFRILRLTFHRKSASKCLIREIKVAPLINF